VLGRWRSESVDDGQPTDETLRSSLYRIHQQTRQDGRRRLQVEIVLISL
jgi:hypothetical protein